MYYKEGIENSQVYEDGQDGYDYTKGRYNHRKFKLHGKPKKLSIHQHIDGTFIFLYKTIEIKFHGLHFKINGIEIGNEKVSIDDIKRNGNHSLEVNKYFSSLTIMRK